MSATPPATKAEGQPPALLTRHPPARGFPHAMIRIPAMAGVLAVLLLALAVSFVVMSVPTNFGGNSAALLLPVASHADDYFSARDELERHGFRHGERISLGAPKLFVSASDFRLARQRVGNHARRHALTVRIARDATAAVWEVWEHGKKLREESSMTASSTSP